MRMVLSIIAVGILGAVVTDWLPLAWGFVALTLVVFLCYWSIYDLLIPLPQPDQDEDE
jgi:hypothetical protein